MSQERSQPPRTTVIVSTRDRPLSVGKTVARLRDQVGALPFEIVVVDDGSGSAVTLDGVPGGPVVRVSHIPHQGRSAARNHGSELARGSILLFVDDDISVGSGFVAAHDKAHQRWDRAMAVGAVALSDCSLETPFGRFRRRLEGMGVPETAGIVCRPNFCTAANMSIPREVFADLGGFNPHLHCAEDQDLALRHSGRGDPIAFVPEAVGVHEDLALDIRSYCRNMEWTGRQLVAFCQAAPRWPENEERLRLNGPALPGREAAAATLKKLAKTVLGQPAPLAALFVLTSLVERSLGDGRLLDALYQGLVGIHIQKGFRSALRVGLGKGEGTRSAR